MILTRCPHCGTTFGATPEQLKARRGKVRCGQCQTVFDGLESLVDMPAVAPMPAPSAEEAPTVAEATEIAEEAPEIAEEAAAYEAFPAEPPPEPLPSPPIEEAPRRRAWPWALGIFLFALPALSIQALLHFRVELAVIYPEAKPALLAACELLGCDLPLPRRIDRVSIESSDLHPAAGPIDPSNDGRLRLVASLRNRAPFAQAWPHLELTLTDTDDRTLLRKALAPAEYLPPEASRADGFAAGAEQTVTLALEAPGVAAVGYRLYVFHP